jgi:hypothetical protein
MDWQNPDLRGFKDEDNDEARIGQGVPVPVPCRICQSMFGRLRLTVRYCRWCKRAFCEGEHGTFSKAGAYCVRCEFRQ